MFNVIHINLTILGRIWAACTVYILVPVLQVVFQECVKDQDPETVASLLRRVSVDIDVNRINTAGMTALHQVRSVADS